MVQLWVRSDQNPEDVDWSKQLPPGYELDSARVRSFPWADVHHEITWWITRPMTLQEWGELDNAENEVLYRIIGEHYMGTAGPIPMPAEEEA